MQMSLVMKPCGYSAFVLLILVVTDPNKISHNVIGIIVTGPDILSPKPGEHSIHLCSGIIDIDLLSGYSVGVSKLVSSL